MKDEPALRLHRAPGIHHLPAEPRRHGQRLPAGDVFQRHPRRSVKHDTPGTFGAVLENEDHRPVEIRVPQLRHGNE